MSSKFKLTLTNGVNDCDVVFDVHATPIAAKWAHEIAQSYPLFEVNRFTNWPGNTKTDVYYANKLNQRIDIVNDYRPGIILAKLDADMDQITMNYLHKYFEDLRGPIETGTSFFNSAPNAVQQALMDFNIIIHEYEHFAFNRAAVKVTNHPYATIVGTYHRPRFELDEEDYQYYTYMWKFGTVYINYCEVGKPLLDVFKDQDDIVGDTNIRPLHYYSADFQIKFGPSTPDEIYLKRSEEFKQWFTEREEFFKSIGINWGPKMALGLIPVATINTYESGLNKLSPVEIVEKLSAYQQIKATELCTM